MPAVRNPFSGIRSRRLGELGLEELCDVGGEKILDDHVGIRVRAYKFVVKLIDGRRVRRPRPKEGANVPLLIATAQRDASTQIEITDCCNHGSQEKSLSKHGCGMFRQRVS